MLRVAHYWDLLSPYQFLLILCFGCVLAFQVWPLIRARRAIVKGSFMVLIIGTLLVGLDYQQSNLPGGGFYDTSYDSLRVKMYMLQERLAEYKNECGYFPTTEQGLAVAYFNDSADRCENKTADERFPDIKYISDGKTYEMESIRKFSIEGLTVRATSEDVVRLYIRE